MPVHATPAASESHSTWRGLFSRESSWPPIVAWCIATGAMALVCVAEGRSPFAATKTWSRADSFLYLDIARHGYTLFACNAHSNPIAWCGNAGWFPAYPWLVAGLAHLGLPLAPAALVVSWLFGFGTILLLWNAMPDRGSHGSLIAIAYAAVAPGIVFSYGVFPLSLLTFFSVAFVMLLRSRRHLLGGVAAGMATLAYPLGVVLAVAGCVWLLADRARPRLARLRPVSLVLLPTLAGGVAFAVDQRVETGRWNAYFLVQRKYDHRLENPISVVFDALRGLGRNGLFSGYHAIELQTLLVTFVLACVVVELIVGRRAISRCDVLVALWAVGAWCLVLVETDVSIWRGEDALVPLALLVRRLPARLAAAVTAAAFAIMLAMTRLYLRDQLN